MKWPSSSLDLNPIKNLWSVVKMKLYEDGKQYNCKADLLEAIKTTMLEIESAHGVMIIIVGNEHGDTSSNPGRD